GVAARGPPHDHRALARVDDPSPRVGHAARRPSHRSEPRAAGVRRRVRASVPERPAPRTIVHLVLRRPGDCAGWALVQDRRSIPAAVPRRDGLPRVVHCRARVRAGPRRNRIAAARAEERGPRARADARADVPVRPPSDGSAADRASSRFRNAQHLQELRRVLDHRAARVDGPGEAARRLHGPRVRVVPGRHGALPARQRRHPRRDARGGIAHARSRIPGQQEVTMYEFDWSSIPGALPFLWQGMKVSLAVTALAVAVGIAWGTVIAVMRLSPAGPISWFAAVYVSLFRSVPLVMVLLWFFLIVPQLLLVELLLFAGAVYFVLCSAASWFVRILRGRLAV